MSGGKIGRQRQGRLLADPANAHQRRHERGLRVPPHLLAARRERPRRTELSILTGFLLVLVGVVGGLGGLAAAGAAGTYYYFTRDLPSLDQVRTSQFETTKIYDRNGKLHGETRNAVEIDCVDCHGTVSKRATLITSGPAAPAGGTALAALRTPFRERRFAWEGGGNGNGFGSSTTCTGAGVSAACTAGTKSS